MQEQNKGLRSGKSADIAENRMGPKSGSWAEEA